MKNLHLNFKLQFLLLCLLVSLTSSAQCNEPTGVLVSDITSNGAKINWTESISAPGEGYQFEIRTSGAPGSGLTGLVDAGVLADGVFTASVSGLLCETSYSAYLRYQCTAAPLYSDWTTAVVFETTELPAPVAGLGAGISDTFFTARWIGVSGATGYRIDVSTSDDFLNILPDYNNLFVPNTSTTKLISELVASTDYYYRVRAEGNSSIGPVTSENSNEIKVTTTNVPTYIAVWTINGWLEDIEPTIDYDVILDYHFVSDENNTTMSEVKSLTLNEGYTFTLVSGYALVVNENIINNSTPQSFVVESNANLTQYDDLAPANEGEITVKRSSSEVFRLDYTMWSSPVVGTQTLKQFSPSTANGRFYEYNSASDVFSTIDPLTTTFSPGSGYLIRARNNHVENNGINAPAAWQGSFVGVPNKGEVLVSLNSGYNMVGNPYPTVLSADEFIISNAIEASNIDSALYFWRRTNDITGEGDTGSFYAVYNPFGSTKASDSSDLPNGFIQVGQGFLVQALSSELIFDSSMKISDNFDDQFFKNNSAKVEIEKHRVWLNLTNNNGVFSQLLVGYAEGASDQKDSFDAGFINDTDVALTSLINNKEYTIQAKALPFTSEDTIPLGFKVVVPGQYTISLKDFDGLFDGEQAIYIYDATTETIHDLKESAYVFAAEAGVQNDRFELRFSNETLGLQTPNLDKAIVVFTKENSIQVEAGNIIMNNITLYDIQGRKLVELTQVNASQVTIESLRRTNQVLLIQITDDQNNIITKKLVF